MPDAGKDRLLHVLVQVRGWSVGRRAAVIAGVLAVVMSTGVLRSVVVGPVVPAGTRVAGVDIGDLAPARAVEVLRRELAPVARRPIEVTAGRHRFSITAAQAGLSLDAEATVAAAGGGFPSPEEIIRPLLGGRDVEPRVRAEEGRLPAVVGTIAKQVDRPMREGAVTYEGTKPKPVMPKTGYEIDRRAAEQAIIDAFLAPRPRAAALEPRRVTPTVTGKEVERVAETAAHDAVDRPFELTYEDRTVRIEGAEVAPGLRYVADGRGSLRPELDATEIAGKAGKKFVKAAQAPRDATFTVKKGRLKLVPARQGQGIDPGELSRSMIGALAKKDRRVPVGLVTTQPDITTDEAGKLGIKEKISSFTTRHPCCAPRVTNIHTIAGIVDGHIVRPGETFSLNDVVGKRDRERGFVPAPMILNGRYVDDVGGGVSQFATTMFNAVFFSGLEDVQHTPHQFYISRYPAGRESTVSFPEPDFRWRNDSPYGVLIKTSYTDTSITVSFWSTKRFDIESDSSSRYDVRGFETITDSGPDCIPMPGAAGFAIDVWRIFKRDGEVTRKQRFHTVYAPEPKLTCTAAPG